MPVVRWRCHECHDDGIAPTEQQAYLALLAHYQTAHQDPE